MTNAHKIIRTTAQFEQVKRLPPSIRSIDFPNQRTNNTKIKIIISLTSLQGFKGFAQRGRIKERKIFMETKTKRIFAAIIAFCMLTVILPMTVIAENPYEGSCGQNGGNLNWSYNETTKTLTISGTGNMSNYYSSGTAGGRAPWVNSKIKDEIETVVISEGAASIGEYAFFECTGLKNVTIPGTVKTINEGAFYKCSGLTSPQPEKSDDEIVDSITIPYGVTSIGDEVFAHCTGLKKVTIPGSVKSIGERAFSDCHISTEESEDGTERGLEKVAIENGTETIGKEAFNGCKKLNDIILPDSVTSIGENAFQYTGLYYEWFDGNEDVLYINNHLISVYQGTANECNIKSGTKTIADSAFFACGSLPGITIPDSVTSIGNRAFKDCNSLKSITIPKSVTTIGNCAFYTCYDLQSIEVDSGNPEYCSENGVLYNKEKTEIIRFPKEKTEVSFAIPKSVTKIADGAFEYCKNLTNVTIPNDMTSIGNNAFESCSGLTNITIPKSVTSIGDRAFSECSKLTSIIIPDGVLRIGESSFFKCSSLKDITIPNSVLIIDTDAFKDCMKLKQVYYIGSKDDWNNEVIGNGKYVLTNVGITCLSGISAKRSADGKSIVVKPINIADGKTVILVLYDGDKIVEMQQSSEYSETKREITFTPTEHYTRAKVMIWNSFNEMSPVCDFKSIE